MFHAGRAITFTVSIGCALMTREISALETALRTADNRMYDAKRNGRNCVVAAPLSAA